MDNAKLYVPRLRKHARILVEVIKNSYVVMDKELNHCILIGNIPSWMEESRKYFIQKGPK